MSIGIIIMGLLIGFMVGLTGVGGAAMLTPILILLGINPSIAVGTDLFYNSITKLFGSIQHYRQKTIDLKLVQYLAIGSIPSAIFAVGMLHLFDTYFHNQEQIIKHALGYVLILVAIATLIKTFMKKKMEWNRWQLIPLKEKRMLTITIGAVLGFIVGITSIGSGSLFALVMLYLYRMSPSQLVGTDIAHAFLLVTAAGLMHAGIGNVDYLLTINLLLGSIPGVLFGSTLSSKLPAKPLRTVMALMILFSGIKLI
ncbi:sulfite exporter TauE/SafE family protein [Neobacillus thermocopriae]|uniref:Probable membrane transporter protein n=1 Tax=Neobacillus thermocopriae TaxID=1215031 RepID=A0A6B3TPG0_9BACI|nr:sulfite exporter TauE/SafE family protein [Neobacillus thermocopriae]MED3624130.1 sulfite exporter TauE/SafE family protein [Neobacillus thermocopriae]MED3713675.1 sulfite exporter TauE/SafE family protein [Neobacillus thermocopriae]NEX78180.1 sulfite exporter TauE/SafE family protein [Neobacillus thermocopriae]